MERNSESNRPCEQPDEVKRQDIVVNLKSLQDMVKGMFENLERKLSEMLHSQINTENKLSESNQKLIRKCQKIIRNCRMNFQ
jgi:hypothetical protein